MLRKGSVGRSLRWGTAAVTAGAAWLGLGLILADDDPTAALGLIAALLALAGGWAGRASGRPAVVRALACLLPVVVARWAAGSLAAALATVCVGAGWWLGIRSADAVLGLAFFGGAVAAMSSASLRLILAFLALGVLTVVARPLLARTSRGLRLIAAPVRANEAPQRPANGGDA